MFDWMRSLVKELVAEFLKDAEFDMEMQDGKPVYKLRVKKEF